MSRSGRFRTEWLWLQLLAANTLMMLALKICSLRRILAVIAWIAIHTPRQLPVARDEFVESARRCLRRIKRQGPVRGKCLSRSLALFWLLRRYGIASAVQIGVRLGEKGFAAHAWVEIEGRPVNGSPRVGTRYGVFDYSFGNRLS